jgi:Rrf2 family transcriptional regulator, nitric oxide-sensitive transcriptional repressor
MFSQTTEYALRVMVYLGSLAGQTPTIAQISAATRTPPAYLAKVLRSLARSGLIRSQRGLHGGSSIARPSGEITIYDVVQAVDPIRRITTCPLGLKGHGVELCPLHRRLDDAVALVEKAFRETTLAELLANGAERKPLCDIPTDPRVRLAPLRLLREKRAGAARIKGHRKAP